MERGRGWWTKLGGNGDNGEPGNRKAREEGRPTWSNLLFRPWSDVQEAPGKARSEASFQAPTGQMELGKKPPRYRQEVPLLLPLTHPFGFGEEGEAAPCWLRS